MRLCRVVQEISGSGFCWRFGAVTSLTISPAKIYSKP